MMYRTFMLTIGLTLLASSAYGQMLGATELLPLVAQRYDANRQQLQTWMGTARVVHERIAPAGPQSVGLVEFFYDARLDAVRWNWTFESEWDNTVGSQGLHPNPGFCNCIVKDGKFYRYGVYRPGESRKRQVLIRDIREERSRHRHPTYFNPKWFLVAHGLEPLSKRIMELYEVRNHPKNRWIVSREGEKEEETVAFWNRKGFLLNHYELDLSKAGQLVEFRIEEENKKTTWVYSYEQVKGVWVPKTHSFRKQTLAPFDERQKKRRVVMSHGRSIEWLTNRVNDDISADVFDVDSL